MVVCLESFLLQNLAMNALVLALALRLAGRRLKPGRLALAAGLGTAYAYLSCLQRAAFLRGVPFQILCVLCMCLLVLGSVRPRSFLRLAGFCYVATALLGGTGFGLMGLMGARGVGLLQALLSALVGGVGLVAVAAQRLAQAAVAVCKALALRGGRLLAGALYKGRGGTADAKAVGRGRERPSGPDRAQPAPGGLYRAQV